MDEAVYVIPERDEQQERKEEFAAEAEMVEGDSRQTKRASEKIDRPRDEDTVLKRCQRRPRHHLLEGCRLPHEAIHADGGEILGVERAGEDEADFDEDGAGAGRAGGFGVGVRHGWKGIIELKERDYPTNVCRQRMGGKGRQGHKRMNALSDQRSHRTLFS